MENRIPVEVKGAYLFKDAAGAEWIYILLEDEAKRQMPIYVDQCAGWAVRQGLEDSRENKEWERPLAYEAMLACLSVTGAVIEEACIKEVRGEFFYAQLTLRVGDQTHSIEILPSDAINLAIRAKCPLLIKEEVAKFIVDRQKTLGKLEE